MDYTVYTLTGRYAKLLFHLWKLSNELYSTAVERTIVDVPLPIFAGIGLVHSRLPLHNSPVPRSTLRRLLLFFVLS